MDDAIGQSFALSALSCKAKGFVGEFNGYEEALARNEVPILSPHRKNINVRGPDYVTVDPEEFDGPVLYVYDAAWHTKSIGEVARKVQTIWRSEISDGVAAMPEGSLKRAAQKALRDDRVIPRRYLYT